MSDSLLNILDNFGVVESTAPLLDKDGNIYTTVIIGSQEWIVENLCTTHYADGTPIPNLDDETPVLIAEHGFLPSIGELQLIYTNLYLEGKGSLSEDIYWSSTENSGSQAIAYDFSLGTSVNKDKNESELCPVCFSYITTGVYGIGEIGLGGGYVFYVNDNLDGTYTYFELLKDALGYQQWNYTDITLIGTSADVGEGVNNTYNIISFDIDEHPAAASCYIHSLSLVWENDIYGAYCYYDNDSGNKDPYGALYNWHTVDNAHGLCYFERDGVEEEGWRIPDDDDFLYIQSYLGGEAIAGAKLKETGFDHWDSPNTGATDEYGFKGRGGGWRNGETGEFMTLKIDGIFRASTDNGILAYEFDLQNDELYSQIVLSLKGNGLSVRCVRDVV